MTTPAVSRNSFFMHFLVSIFLYVLPVGKGPFLDLEIPLGGQEADRVGRNAFPPADETHAFIGLGLDADSLSRNT